MSEHFFDIEPGTEKELVAYNNLASQEEREGRLTATIELGERYRLGWEFEWYDEDAPRRHGAGPAHHEGRFATLEPIVGYDFRINKPRTSTTGPRSWAGRKYRWDGTFTEGSFGDTTIEVEQVSFYLVNLVFGSDDDSPYRNQIFPKERFSDFERRDVYGVTTEDGFATHGFKDFIVEVFIDDYWSVRLDVKRDFIGWKGADTGFYITAKGRLSGPRTPTRENVRTLPFGKMRERVDNLALLLSFANGGLTSVPYIEGSFVEIEGNKILSEGQAGQLLSAPTTPLQDVGMGLFSWTGHDLGRLIATLPAFEQMLATWGEYFRLLLADYHKALSPYAPFQSRVRSISSALETLAMLLFRREFDGKHSKTQIKKLFSLSTKLEALAWIAGIPSDSYDVSLDIVKDLRHESAHAELSVDSSLRDAAFRTAVTLFEEVMLWRLGYTGKYCPKTDASDSSFGEPRYKLQYRLPQWV